MGLELNDNQYTAPNIGATMILNIVLYTIITTPEGNAKKVNLLRFNRDIDSVDKVLSRVEFEKAEFTNVNTHISASSVYAEWKVSGTVN